MLANVPYDIWAHLIGGMFLYWILTIIFNLSKWQALSIVILMAASKELFIDYNATMLNEMYFEPVKDIAVSGAGAVMAGFITPRQPRVRR